MRALAPVLAVIVAVSASGCATGEDVDDLRPASGKGDAAAAADADDPDGSGGDAATSDDTGGAADAAVDTVADTTVDTAVDVVVDTGPTCDGGGTWCGDEPGCRDLANDLSNCGACGKTCATVPNATPLCTTGACGFTCDTGFDDCDSDASDGCETSLLTDGANCGACGKVCLASESCVAGACAPKAVIVESFESTTWPTSAWKLGSGSGTAPGSTSTACAHDGARGYAPAASGPAHYYRTDVTVGAPGTKISAWYRTTGAGRGYLGFGATASGTWSFVAGPNTGVLMFERHFPYGTYETVASKARTWATGTWFKLEVSFAAGGVATGRVYASDGTTVIDTLSATIPGFAPGGVALRAFAAGTCLDTIEL